MPGERTLGLDGNVALIGKPFRLAVLIVAIGNLLPLWVPGEPLWFRSGRSGLILWSAGLLWWSRTRPISWAARLLFTGGMALWLAGEAAIRAPSGWPLSLDLVPVLAALVALTVDWRAAGGLVVITGGVAVGALATSVAAVPTLQGTGNWLLVNGAMLYLVFVHFRVIDQESDDLIRAASDLERTQQEATVVAAKVALQVRQRLDTLWAGLAAGPGAVRAAMDALQQALRESRGRIPPEPPPPTDQWAERMGRIRDSLARDLVGFGAVIYSVRIAQNLSRGRTAIALILGMQLVLLLLVVWGHRRHWLSLRRTLHVAAGITVLGTAANLANWDQVVSGVQVLPSIPITLLLLLVLAAIGGEVRLLALWGPLLGGAVVLWLPSRAIPTLLLILAYLALGYVLATLQRGVLEALVNRQQRAATVIRHRRRLIGTLFHDLANPMQALAMQVELDDPDEASAPPSRAVPAEAVALVDRMRATLASALGELKPPERMRPADLVEALQAVFGTRLAEKRIQLVPACDPEAVVHANRSLLVDTVLANLLSNAIKFTPPGGAITFRCSRADDHIRIAIGDQGPGLPAEVLAAFATGRVAPSRLGSAGERGSGHGLLLTRDYLQEMGGSLTFEHPPTGGLVARETLPAA